MDKEARARAASVESELMGLFKADELGEGELGSSRSVIGIPTGGWHVVTSCEGLCGPVAEVGAA